MYYSFEGCNYVYLLTLSSLFFALQASIKRLCNNIVIIRYRLAAIDHGQFSFVDLKHNDWPVVLITNPKNILFRMPQRENLESLVTSTHIR